MNGCSLLLSQNGKRYKETNNKFPFLILDKFCNLTYKLSPMLLAKMELTEL